MIYCHGKLHALKSQVAIAMVQKKTSPVLSKKTHKKNKTKPAEVETAQGWLGSGVKHSFFFKRVFFSFENSNQQGGFLHGYIHVKVLVGMKPVWTSFSLVSDGFPSLAVEIAC